MHSEGESRRVRKKRKHGRKLSDNRELLSSVVVMVVCGLLVIGFLTYVLSTRSCRLPKFLQ